jgi:hypothetical protein
MSSRSSKSADDSDFVLSISAHVVGTGGEVYSTFGRGPKFRDEPPKPAFTLTAATGRKLASGNLEFG